MGEQSRRRDEDGDEHDRREDHEHRRRGEEGHGDTSGHALRSRLRTLQAVASPDQAAWRWHQIVETATAGVEIAHRLNRVTGRLSLARIDDSALRAAAVVGAAYREWARRHRAA